MDVSDIRGVVWKLSRSPAKVVHSYSRYNHIGGHHKFRDLAKYGRPSSCLKVAAIDPPAEELSLAPKMRMALDRK